MRLTLAVLLFVSSGCGVGFRAGTGGAGGTDDGTTSGGPGGAPPGTGGGGVGGDVGGSGPGGIGGREPDCTDPAVRSDYVVHHLEGTITVDGVCDEAVWQAAPLAPWEASNNESNNTFVDCRFLWQDGTADSFYGCCTVGDDDIEADIFTVDANDIWNDDSLEFFVTNHFEPDWAPTSIKTFVSPADIYRDADWSDEPQSGYDVSYDGGVVVSQVVGSLNDPSADTSYTMEWRQDLGFEGTPESLIGCAFRMNDSDMMETIDTSWQAFGETLHINDAGGLHRCKLACTPP